MIKKNQATSILGLLVALGVVWFFFLRTAPATDWPVTNAFPRGETIVAFGDSLTEGYGVAPEESYPAQLSRRLGKPIVNSGRSGDTTAGGLRRLDADVLAHDPRIVLLCLGGNDMKNRAPIDQQFQNLRLMIEQIQAEGAMVVLIGVEGDGFLISGNYGERFENLARETGSVYVPNLLDGLLGRGHLMVDTIHPNAEGYAVFVDRLMDEAGEYLVR